jgi:uncharacterized C2H2 Zn-finger protein
MECIPSKKHICTICNKEYSTRQNLWKHNNKFHVIESNESNPNVIQKSIPVVIPKSSANFICIKCNAIFKYKQGKWKHEKKCSINKSNDQTEILKKQNEELKTKMDEMTKMFDTLLKKIKVHPKTLQKINNTLTNNNSNNNTINNTYNIVALGKEKLSEIYSIQEKVNILKYGHSCFTKLIEYTHTNDKYPQFKNILITNLRDNIGYMYNMESGKFEATTKDELLHNIIVEQTIHIYDFKDECDKYLSPKEQERVQYVIDKFDSDCPIFETKQKDDIKLIIYNNRHKITKEPCRDLEIIV